MSPPGRPKGEYRSAQHGGDQVNTAAPLDHGDIAGLIPHAGRMCLLARVDAWDARTIRCTATSHADADHPLRSASSEASAQALCGPPAASGCTRSRARLRGVRAGASSSGRPSACTLAAASSRPAPKLPSCAHRLVELAWLPTAMCQ